MHVGQRGAMMPWRLIICLICHRPAGRVSRSELITFTFTHSHHLTLPKGGGQRVARGGDPSAQLRGDPSAKSRLRP